MIIGVSGKIGSGKDTVGKIIQYLTNPFDRDMKTTFNPNEDYSPGCPWRVRKFADKLKDIVCMLIGCTREQLEDREFKEKELGEEWWYYKGETKLISYNEATEIQQRKLPLIKPTPRLLLQLIGTDLFRNKLHPNIWVNALMVDYKESQLGQAKRRRKGKTFPIGYFLPNWIITDVRFPNEAKTIKDRGGILIRVNRKIAKEEDVNQSLLGAMSNYKEHPSEIALDNYQDWDYIIQNDGTIEDLIEKVKEILIMEKIL